ncbi:MAG: PDZ domain-containing protein [Planctomycetota bacterium]
MTTIRLAALAGTLLLGACAALSRPLPEAQPPLADMEEPLALMEEPQDEEARLALPVGGFTGVYVKTGAETLDELAEGADGVLVERVVENSPGAIAGLAEGDLLLEARGPRDAGPVELAFPSRWREVELASREGDEIAVLYDRAGAERETTVRVVRRLAPPDREAGERFREEKKVGIVVRTATEVEARGAGLGPGGGAVVVGLSKASPWRAAGLRFGDVIVEAAGRRVEHPQVVLDVIRARDSDDRVDLRVRRGEEDLAVDAPLSRRQSEAQEVSVPPLFGWESKGERSSWSFLLGFLGYEETAAAWRGKFLWFITFGGGDVDALEEVESSEVDTLAPAPADEGAAEARP